MSERAAFVPIDAPQRLAEDDFPALFRAADRASVAGRHNYVRLVGVDLAMLLAGGALSAIAPLTPDDWSSVLRAGSVALLTVGLIVKSASRVRSFDSEWFDGRAVAESVKTTAWRYMMRVPPFDGDERSADAAYIRDLREIMSARSGLVHLLSAQPSDERQITARMRRLRELDLAERRGRYLTERLDDQINWYTRRAQRSQARSMRWFWTGLAVQSIAIAGAVLAIVVTDAQNVVSVFAAVAAATTAWTQLNRHDELSKSYSLAAQELILLKSELELAEDDETLAKAVGDAESAISREHTMWMARRR